MVGEGVKIEDDREILGEYIVKCEKARVEKIFTYNNQFRKRRKKSTLFEGV